MQLPWQDLCALQRSILTAMMRGPHRGNLMDLTAHSHVLEAVVNSPAAACSYNYKATAAANLATTHDCSQSDTMRFSSLPVHVCWHLANLGQRQNASCGLNCCGTAIITDQIAQLAPGDLDYQTIQRLPSCSLCQLSI